MSRCGCPGCRCVLKAGPLTEVDGLGRPGKPYRVTIKSDTMTAAEISQCAQGFLGPGVAYDPGTQTFIAHLSADADNQMRYGSDDGIAVFLSPCPAVAECLATLATTTLEWDPASGTLRAGLSTDANNGLSYVGGELFCDPGTSVVWGAWQNITLINSWTGTVQYRVATLPRRVQFRGLATRTGLSTTPIAICNLPAAQQSDGVRTYTGLPRSTTLTGFSTDNADIIINVTTSTLTAVNVFDTGNANQFQVSVDAVEYWF